MRHDASRNCSAKHGTLDPTLALSDLHLCTISRHNLTKPEKLSYLDAEKCLMKLPAKVGLPGTRTRFDELQAAHAMQSETVHEVVG